MPKSLLAWLHPQSEYVDYGSVDYWLGYFRKHYGISKMLKGIIFSSIQLLKKSSLDLREEHVVDVNGCKLSTIPNDSGISYELLLFKTHEPLATEVLKKVLKKGMVCLDAGSNIGYYALLELKLAGNEGKVIAVEPSSLNYSYLKKNIHQNGFDDAVTFRLALSSSDGVVPFLMHKYSNLSKVVDENYSYSEGSIVNVPARSLDSLTEQYHLDKLDFLRMDVEGYETEIFRGGQHTIEKFRPVIFIEVHKSILGLKATVDFLRSLQNLGYDIKYYIPRELDHPLIGNMKDIQKLSITQLIEKLKGDLIPGDFHLFLVNSEHASLVKA
jgi:FkbM family methyltransferase